MSAARPWRAAPGGLLIAVRATPKGGADRIDGLGVDAEGRPALLVRVSAAASDGAANEALRRLLARAAGSAPSAATLEAGALARSKRFRIAGDPAALAAALEAAVAGR